MSESKIPEITPVESASPPPFLGRSATLTAQKAAEVLIALAFGDVSEESVSEVLGIPSPSEFLELARARGVCTVALDIANRAKSEARNERSDPRND